MPLNRKLTYQEVRECFEKQRCGLLSTEYKNARTHLDYICSCGNQSRIVYDSFRRGHRCNKCAQVARNKKQSLNIEAVRNFFKYNGCELLSDIYIKNSEPLQFICHCGNISTISFLNFKHRKRCSTCGLQARSGKNHYEWKDDRTAYYKQRCLRYRCHTMLRMTLKSLGLKKQGSSENILGYTTLDLIKHLKSFHDYDEIVKTKWDIDHIFPIQAFIEHGITDIRIINSLENLQPLKSSNNRSKSDKYDKVFFHRWLEVKGISYVKMEK